LLSDQNTFDFYSIRQKDIIVAIPAESDPGDFRKWSSVTDDSETFAEKMSYLTSQGTSREVARLRDYQMIRAERRPRSFRKLISNYQNSGYGRVTSTLHVPLAIPSAPLLPNSNPLPIFWRRETTRTLVDSTQPFPVMKDEQIVSEQSPDTLQP
jgi:hypothetical protein